MDKEIERILKMMQTSVHDQINALKVDVQRMKDDSQTALEICAELERSVNISDSDKRRIQILTDVVDKIIEISSKEAEDNTLNFNRLRILSGINHLCWNISVLAFIKLRVCADDPNVMYSCIQPLFALRELYDKSRDKLDAVRKNEDLNSVVGEFADKFLLLQGEIQSAPSKLLDGSEIG